MTVRTGRAAHARIGITPIVALLLRVGGWIAPDCPYPDPYRRRDARTEDDGARTWNEPHARTLRRACVTFLGFQLFAAKQ